VPRPRVYITQPVAKTAVARLRQIAAVTMNPDASRVIGKRTLISAVRRCDCCSVCCMIASTAT
jgi:glyoxylate reductase